MSVADDFAYGAEYMFQPTHLTSQPNGKAEAEAIAADGWRSTAAPENGKPGGGGPTAPSKLHRLAEVRRQQGLSVRSAARRMGVSISQVRQEEKPDSNLSLHDLVRWQCALEVPMVDLLVDENSPLSSPVVTRARWLRLMKTVKALLEASPSPSISRMVEMLEKQVLEVMPELKDVGAWHSVGQRRTQDEMGRIAESPVSSNFARDGLS